MIIPNDWDQPSDGNDLLCKKFKNFIFRSNDSTYYLPNDLTQNITLPYRLYQASATENPSDPSHPSATADVNPTDRLPLVVYLHGADTVGADNEQQLSAHDIGTMFVRDSFQKRHPCHVIAPQYGRGMHWSVTEIGDAVHKLVTKTVKELQADPDRCYIYGYSAGGVGTLRYVRDHPDFYAAAISICGAIGGKDLDKLKSTPLWMIHAKDDMIVKDSYREGTEQKLYHYGSHDIYNAIHDIAPMLRFTEFPAGYMKKTYGVNPHCSWVAVSDQQHPEYAEWMFAHSKSSNPHI